MSGFEHVYSSFNLKAVQIETLIQMEDINWWSLYYMGRINLGFATTSAVLTSF